MGTCLFQSGNGSRPFGNRQAGGWHALRHEAGHETGRRERKLTGPWSPSLRGRVPLGPRDGVSGRHQEGFHKRGKGKPSKLRHDARSPGRRKPAGAFRLCGARAVSSIRWSSCFVACPMKRKGRMSRVRTEERCRFPAASVRASGEGRSRKARWEDRAGLCISGEVQSVAKGRGLSRFFFLTDLNTER